MPRYRDNDEDAGSSNLLFLAAGALAGVAAGVYFAQRFGGVAGLTSRIRERFSGADADPAPVGDDEEDTDTHHAHRHFADDPYDDDADDDAEGDSDGADDDESADDEMFVSADEELEERVLETFVNDPILRQRAVDIGAIDDATIELTGHVFSPAESDHAVVIARGTPGVEAVINHLTIRADEQDEEDDLSIPSQPSAGVGDRPWSPAPPPNGG
jgi:hypothetical protein